MANSERSDIIEAALMEAMSKDEEYAEGDIIIEWCLVSYVQNPDREKGNRYPIFVSNGRIPTHRLKGLLHHVLDLYGKDL